MSQVQLKIPNNLPDTLCAKSPALSIYSTNSEMSASRNSFGKLSSLNIQARFKLDNISTVRHTPSKHKTTINKKYSELVSILKKLSKTNLSQNYILTNEILGSGAFGTVYLVRKKCNNSNYAAKVFNKRNQTESKIMYWDRIASEVYISSILHNENCVKLVDVATHKGSITVVMEYYPYDLISLIAERNLNKTQMRIYFCQLVRGVQYLHSYGIGHRDLKLENICISTDDKIKIVDFGCAKMFKAGLETYFVKSSSFYGSGAYYAPELFNITPRDIRKADVWSIGIIFIALQTKNFPWKFSHSSDTNYTMYKEDRRSFLESIFKETEIVEMMLQILDPNPETRISIEELTENPNYLNLEYIT